MLSILIRKDYRIMRRNVGFSACEVTIPLILFTLSSLMFSAPSSLLQNRQFERQMFEWEDLDPLTGNRRIGSNQRRYEPTKTTINNLRQIVDQKIDNLMEYKTIRGYDIDGTPLYVGISENGSQYNMTVAMRANEFSLNAWQGWMPDFSMDRLIFTELVAMVNQKIGDLNMTEIQKPNSPQSILFYMPSLIVHSAARQLFQIMQLFTLLIVVSICRNIVHEKATFRQYLVTMGLPISTYYQAHFLFNLAKCLFIFMPGIIIFGVSTLSPMFVICVCVSTCLYLISIISFAFLIASCFHTQKSAILSAVICWICLNTVPIFTIGADLDKLMDVGKIVPGCLVMFTITWHCLAEMLCTMSTLKQASIIATEHRPMPLWALWLILVLNSLVMFGAAIFVENFGVLRRRWCHRRGGGGGDEHRDQHQTRSQSVTVSRECTSPKRSNGGSDSALLGGCAFQDETHRKTLVADIDIRDCVKRYATGETAVKGLTMRAIRGQVAVLVGHNGCGKSTTFAMIAGMIQPTEGSIKVGGLDIVENRDEARRKIGFCPQYNPLIDKLTVLEHLKIVHTLKRAETDFESEADQLLDAIKLTEKRDTLAKNLSGGQKRKLCMLMALIGESCVVLLDEPTAGMDAAARQDVQTMLRSTTKTKRTILLTTHNMDEADKLADWLYVMSDGRIEASGDSQFLKTRFGGGWLITVVVADALKDSKIILEFCKEFVPEAVVKDMRGQMIEINVPLNKKVELVEMLKGLEAIAEKDAKIEKKVEISSIGVSLNSLEQVFINIIEQCENGQNKEPRKNKKTILTELLGRIGDEPCATPLISQLQGLNLKRAFYIRRNWILHLLNLIVPLAMLAMALTLMMKSPDEPVFADNFFEMKIGAEMLPASSIVIIQADAATNRQIIRKTEELLARNSKILIRRVEPQRAQNDVILKEQFFRKIAVFLKFENERCVEILINRDLYMAKTIGAFLRFFFEPGVFEHNLEIHINWVIYKEIVGLLSFPNMSALCVFLILITYHISNCAFMHADERTSHFKHQQFLTPMSPIIYWFSMYFWEFFEFVVVVASSIAVLMGFGVIWGWKTTIEFFVISCAAWFSIAPSIFLLSFLINSPTKMYIFLPFVAFLIPAIKIVVDVMFIKSMIPIFYFTHFVCPLQSVIILILWSYYQLDPIGFLSIRPLVLLNFSSEIDDDFDVYLFEGIMLVVSVIFWNFLLFFFTSRWFLRKMNNIMHSSHFAEPKIALTLAPCREVLAVEDAIRSGRMTTDTSTVLIDELVKRYGSCQAVNGVFLGVEAGECFGLLGANGAGKSTMIEILTGKQFACTGEATIGGRAVDDWVKLGYCPQFEAVLSDLTGRDVLTILVHLQNYSKPVEMVDCVLECVGMQENADKRIKYCSGGQKRKISMGMAIISKMSHGELIMLDEPTAGVDPKARRDLWDIIVGVRTMGQIGIMLTSHSMEECEALCSRIGILRKGDLIALGTHQDIISKYGNTFTLTIHVKKREDVEKIVTKIRQTFGATIATAPIYEDSDDDDDENLETDEETRLVWQLTRESGEKWSQKMEQVGKIADEMGIDEYYLVQSTLEDVCIKLNSPNIEKQQQQQQVEV